MNSLYIKIYTPKLPNTCSKTVGPYLIPLLRSKTLPQVLSILERKNGRLMIIRSRKPTSTAVGDKRIPPWKIGNPYNGYINPYYWVDDHPLLLGWCFQKIGKHPKTNGLLHVFIMESLVQMRWFGGPTPIFGNTYIFYTCWITSDSSNPNTAIFAPFGFKSNWLLHNCTFWNWNMGG